MAKVLITAFQPYGRWQANSSWLTLLELTRDLPTDPQVTTRLYPVNYDDVSQKIADDLSGEFDVALHLGQAPGATHVQLESVAVNVKAEPEQPADQHTRLEADGPTAYRSALPLADWASMLRRSGVPAQVSYHAGTYLCNATLYWSHHFADQSNLATQSAFIHLPLDVSQSLDDGMPSLPATLCARAVRLILEQI